MTKRLLIDARQPEETRVVLLSGTRIEDFDYEAKNRRQLKGNVYLARVTRVEPSLRHLLNMAAIARVSSHSEKFTPTIIGYQSKTVKRLLKPKSPKMRRMSPRLRLMARPKPLAVTAPMMMISAHADRFENTKFRQ